MSNSLDLDQARRIVGPDLGPNCLPSLSADDTGRQRVKRLRALDSPYNEALATHNASLKLSILIATVFIVKILFPTSVTPQLIFYRPFQSI